MKTQPIAYEFHNLQTGHCYVDYIRHPDLEFDGEYLQKPLFYASQSQAVTPSDKEMNQKAIAYGVQKSQHRFGITDYERSEAEIDFLRGYNSAVRDMVSQQGYPQEFVEWCLDNEVSKGVIDIIDFKTCYDFIKNGHASYYETLSELYTYWQNEINKQL